jgi:hypothetical protein
MAGAGLLLNELAEFNRGAIGIEFQNVEEYLH